MNEWVRKRGREGGRTNDNYCDYPAGNGSVLRNDSYEDCLM